MGFEVVRSRPDVCAGECVLDRDIATVTNPWEKREKDAMNILIEFQSAYYVF